MQEECGEKEYMKQKRGKKDRKLEGRRFWPKSNDPKGKNMSRQSCSRCHIITDLIKSSQLFQALRLWLMFLSVMTLVPGGLATCLNVRIASFIKTWTGGDLQSSTKQAKRAPCDVVPHLVPTICALHLFHDTLQTQRCRHTDLKLCETDQPWRKVCVL